MYMYVYIYIYIYIAGALCPFAAHGFAAHFPDTTDCTLRYFNVLQCVAVCVLQCVAVCMLQCVAVCVLQCVAVCVLQCVAVCVTPNRAALKKKKNLYCIYRYLRIANVTIWGLAHTGWHDLRHIPPEGGGSLLNVGGLFCRSLLRDIGLFGVILGLSSHWMGGSAAHSGGRRWVSFWVGVF